MLRSLLSLALVCFLTLAQVARSEPTVTGISYTEFPSCAESGGVQLQIIFSGTELASGVNCTFMDLVTNNVIQFSGNLKAADEFLCLAVTLEASVYQAGISFSSEVIYLTTSNITIVQSPISVNDSSAYSENESFLAGEEIVISVDSLSTCGTMAKCSDGANETFSIIVDGMPDLQMVYKEKVDETCKYTLPLYKKGIYDYQVVFNNTQVMLSSILEITTGVTTLDSNKSYIDASNITSVVAGKIACFSVFVLDTYENTIEGLESFQFELEWKGLSVSLVEGPFLAHSNNGEYTVCFEPSVSGNLQLQLTIDGKEIRNSPANVNVSPGSFVAFNSWIRDGTLCPSVSCDETSSSTVQAGSVGTFVIVSRDKYENEKTDSLDVNLNLIEAYIESGNINYTMTAKTSGQYVLLSFNGKLAGSYDVKVKYDGVDLDGGRVPVVNIIANSVDFTNCVVSATGNNTAAAGSNIFTIISSYDSYGNPINGDTNWSAKIAGKSTGIPLPCTVTNAKENQYRASCNATIAQNYDITFYHSGSPLSQTRPVTITPASVFAGNSAFWGYRTTMTAGTINTVTINTYDKYGNVGGTILSFQKFLIQVQLTQNGQIVERFITDTVTQFNQSTYTSNFPLTVAGDYDITVLFVGSPLVALQSKVISVVPDITKGSYCTLEIKSNPIAAQLVWLELRAKDVYGNLQTIDETDDFSVVATSSFDSSATFNCDIVLISPGVYNVSFTPTKASQYQFTGLFKGSEPFSVVAAVIVQPGPISASNSGFATGSSGQTQAEAGSKSYIYIQGRDAANNRVDINENEDDYVVTIQSNSRKREAIYAQKENATEAQSLNGISVYSYSISKTGTYTVSITKNGAHITGSPSQLLISSSANYDESSFTISGPESMKIGETINFVLTMQDIYGNPVDGKDDLDVDLIGYDNGAIVRLQPTFSSGTYTLPFTAELGGRYSLVLSWNNAVLPETKVLDVFSNDGGKCTTFDGPINQGQKWEIICVAYDEYGKEKTSGGNSDTIVVDAPKASYTLTDKGDGSYSILYSSQRIGKRAMSVTFGDRVAKNMPLTVSIIPGSVVLGTVIPAMFVFGLILVAIFVYYRKRKQKEELLLKKRRKPQQVFEVGDYEEEWSDEEEHGEQEENWFGSNMDKEEKLKTAHEMTIKSLAQD